MPWSVSHSAYNRQESRGGHAREDFPDRDDDNWMKHTLPTFNDKGEVSFEYRPVHMFTLDRRSRCISTKETCVLIEL